METALFFMLQTQRYTYMETLHNIKTCYDQQHVGHHSSALGVVLVIQILDMTVNVII